MANNDIYELGKAERLPYPLIALEDIADEKDTKNWTSIEFSKPKSELIPVEDILGTTKSYLSAYYTPETDTLGFSEERRNYVRELLDKGEVFDRPIRVVMVADRDDKKYFVNNDGNHRLSVMRERRARFINAKVTGVFIYNRNRKYNFDKFYRIKRPY